jgi:hypothetical protein
VSDPAGTKMMEGVEKAVKDQGRSLFEVLIVEKLRIESEDFEAVKNFRIA